ncbi:hypothetical protein K8T06_06260, partial [bacterium]|nr:hypothetical protein [bacterium]
MALYNINRETGQNNLYKHQGNFTGWDWIGHESNKPGTNFRDFLLWDVVRYTRDINEDQKDFATDLVSLGESWNFCAFMKFYDTGLDWHCAAEKYRSTYETLDNFPDGSYCPEDHVIHLLNTSDELWPDEAAKFNSQIPGWAKYQPFYLYVSPQHPQSRHTMSQTMVDRIRDWQDHLGYDLEVYSGYNNLMFSTWIVEWADDEANNNIELYRNYPEWAGGMIPCDVVLKDPSEWMNYKAKFFRENMFWFQSKLEIPSPSTVKFISTIHGYFFDGIKDIDTRLTDINNDKLTDDYRGVSWPYNEEKRMDKIWKHVKGFDDEPPNERNYLWGGKTLMSTSQSVPRRKFGVWEINHSSRYGMDYLVGQLVPPIYGEEERDLEFGIIDSQVSDQQRCLGSDGTYLAAGGSVPFFPIYEGYTNLNQIGESALVKHFSTGIGIPPGGGTEQYEADIAILDHLQNHYPAKITVNEGLGECFLDKYDIVMDDLWPTGYFVDSQQTGFMKCGSNLKVQSVSKDGPLPLKWIPMLQTISHDLVIFQSSQNAFSPGLYWHTYLDTYFPEPDTIRKFRWTFYGGNSALPGDPPIPDLDAGWLAFNADMANGYTFGSKLSLFDVDAGLNYDGYIIESPDDENTVDFWHDVNSFEKGAQTLLTNCLKSYKFIGFPSGRDKVAEHLFFGKLLKTPDLHWPSLVPPGFHQNIKYDLDSTIALSENPINIELSTPVVLHTLWKANLASDTLNPEIPRLGFVFCNFSDRGYTVQTKPVDLTKLFGLEGVTYWWYNYSPTATMLHQIGEPESFQVKKTIHPRNIAVTGISPISGIVPPAGPYSMINDDENLDLVQLEDGLVSVVFGDGSMEYDIEDSISVLDGVEDFCLSKISSKNTVDIVCITKTGFEILASDGDTSFETILRGENIFSDASKIVSILETDPKFIVRDGTSLNQLSINPSKKSKAGQSFTYTADSIDCEPVRTFSIENLCSDESIDLVTISEDGSIELLNWTDEFPESMIIIEINTDADNIGFDDTDEDGDLDIVLSNSSKTGDPEVLSYIDGWKFT